MTDSQAPCEQSLKRFISHLEETAQDAINSGKLASVDGSVVKGQLGNLSAYATPMIKIIESAGNETTAEFGFECLWNLLGAAYIIGSRGTVSESVKAFVKTEQASLAREARRLRNVPKRIELRSAILAEAGDDPLVDSVKFADSIRDGVIRRRGGDAKGNSAGTIRRHIKLILEG